MVISFLATFAGTGVTQVVLGGIQVFISDDTEWKKSTISFAVTAGTLASGFLTPFIGRLTDRYGPRWLMAAGMVVAAASFFTIAGTQAVWQFFGAYIFGRAVSNPVLIGVVPRAAAVNFFRRRRNIALALVSTFRPIGGAINIQIISLIAIHWGWRAAYRYLGILSLVLVLPVFLLMRRRPEDIGLAPDGARPGARVTRVPAFPSTGTINSPGRRSAEFSWSASEALRTKSFWLVTIAAGFGTLGSGAVGFSLVPYLADDVGLSKGAAAGVLSLGTFLAIANLGWGYLADFVSPRLCLTTTLIISGAMVLFLITVGSLGMALAFAVAFGMFSSPEDPLEGMMLAQYFGRDSYGTILGLFSPFQTLMLGVGPTLGAVFREVVGSYDYLYLALAVAYMLAGVLVFLARPPALPARASMAADREG